MKRIILLTSVLLIGLQVKAQTYTEEIDRIYQLLDKSPITSNILIDRSFPVAGIQMFNQGIRKDTSNFAHFKQAWNELSKASYIQNFITIEQIEQQLKNKNYTNNIVPIGMINTEFHQGNFGATIDSATVNLNSDTGLLTNKVGKNPFIKKQTTIIAPLVNRATGRSIIFKTDSLFLLHKLGKRIKTLQLFTNNASFILISNYNLTTSNFTTSYTSSGIKTLRFVVTFADDTTKTTYGKVKITIPQTTLRKRASATVNSGLLPIVADVVFRGYDETRAYRGENEYRIYYDKVNGNNIVNKPIIIIDGYDPGDKRKTYKNAPNYSVKASSIYELMSYDHDNNPDNDNEDLVKELQLKGYDVIIVNHPKYTVSGKDIDGGSDYIERNAFVLISLIRHIKSIQQGTEKMVVIGPSMGGLISRYALAYMEKELAKNPNNTAHKQK